MGKYLQTGLDASFKKNQNQLFLDSSHQFTVHLITKASFQVDNKMPNISGFCGTIITWYILAWI